MKTATKLSPELIASYENEGYENRSLTALEVLKMLKSHDADTRELTIMAPINTWTLFDILAFLGY